MRKLILKMDCSLDGFVGGPKGELDWLVPDFDEEDAGWPVDRFWQAGAHLMGSVTYRGMSAYWPTSTEPYAAPMNRIPLFQNIAAPIRFNLVSETALKSGVMAAVLEPTVR